MKIRQPVVAGRFYPANKVELTKLIQKLRNRERSSINFSIDENTLIGGVSPHAGLIYSGWQAIHLYELLAKYRLEYKTFVIINPNHTGLGHGDFNTCSYSHWRTPLGDIPVDQGLQSLLKIDTDNQAHDHEHSAEVQLPLLQTSLSYCFKILPITMNRQHPDTALELAQQLHSAIKLAKKKVFIIASSDFSHYISPRQLESTDQPVVEQILALNTKDTYKCLKQKQASICGYGPIMTLMEYSKMQSDASTIQLLAEGHSGEIAPSNQVVHYISFMAYRNS